MRRRLATAKFSIRFGTVSALCLTTLLALCLSPLVSSASAGGYVTPLFARAQYSGAAAGYLTMDTVVPYLDARNIDADVGVVTGWPLEHDRLVYNANVYLSWDDLRALQDDGWVITSQGRTGTITSGTTPAVTNAEVNGSLNDLLDRGFGRAWSLFSYKSGHGDTLTQRLVRDSYAYAREHRPDVFSAINDLPLAQPERAQTMTTWGGHCNDPDLACYGAAPWPYLVPSAFIAAINGMGADQWVILQSYRFVAGTQLSGKLQFDCTGPETQHWATYDNSSREVYCWNDYKSIIDGTNATFATPDAIAASYGRAIFTGRAPRAGASPTSLAFGTVRRGQTSSAKTVTFMSTGTAPLSVSSVRITGANASDFKLQSDGCTGAVLAGGKSCTVSVAFAPTALNGRNASLTFAHSAAGSPLQVALKGTGGAVEPSHALTVAKSGSGSGSVTSSPAGINCGSTCSSNFNAGTAVTLTANSAAGSTFTGWSGGGCSGTGTCTVTMDSNKTVNATFDQAPPSTHTLTVAKSGSGAGAVTSSPPGINCGSTCSHAYNQGTVVTLTANPAAGSTFTGWSGGGCSGTGTCTVNISSNRSVTATFTAQPPNTKIKKAKIKRAKRRATFKFKAKGRGEATGFQCRLKRKHHTAKKFQKCRSPKTYKHLKRGKYTFKVRAVGPAGKDPSPAKKRFKIKE